ncbi:MAG: hypothetical protein P8Y97_17750 [Candidatus Lokiarchaeota archaeon]
MGFGLLFSFGFTGVAIRTFVSYYFSGESFFDLLLNLSHITISIAVLSFLIVVSFKNFNKIISIKLTRCVLLFAIISSILILVIQNSAIMGLIILISILVGAIYMFLFHINLIHKSNGELKKKLILIFTGEIIIIFSILVRSEDSLMYFSPFIQNFVELVTLPLLLFGPLVVFLGLIRFPVFLEFEWKNELRDFYIVNKKKNQILFEYNFNKKALNYEGRKNFKDNINPKKEFLFSRGIIGIENIMSQIPDKINRLKDVKYGRHSILIQQGGSKKLSLDYILLVKKDMSSARYFLNLLKETFEKIYIPTIENIDSLSEQKLILNGFNRIINNQLK